MALQQLNIAAFQSRHLRFSNEQLREVLHLMLDTDASGESIGALLSQEQNGTVRVVAYASKSLDKSEINYCVTRKELLAVVYFLRHFKRVAVQC